MPKTKIYNYICKKNSDKCLFIITIIMKFIFKPKKKKKIILLYYAKIFYALCELSTSVHIYPK